MSLLVVVVVGSSSLFVLFVFVYVYVYVEDEIDGCKGMRISFAPINRRANGASMGRIGLYRVE